MLDTIEEGIATNSTAYQPPGEKFFVGNKTESAMLKWIEKLGADYKVWVGGWVRAYGWVGRCECAWVGGSVSACLVVAGRTYLRIHWDLAYPSTSRSSFTCSQASQ